MTREALTSSGPKRAFDIFFHQNPAETPRSEEHIKNAP